MNLLMKSLDGYKTYIGFIGLGVLGIIKTLDYIDEASYEWMRNFLLMWTGISLRSAIKKNGNGNEKQ